MATLYAAIANGGKLWLPQIVERVESPDGQGAGGVRAARPPRAGGVARDAGDRAPGAGRRRQRVQGDRVTRRASTDIEVAGKTGTAQVHERPRRAAATRRATTPGSSASRRPGGRRSRSRCWSSTAATAATSPRRWRWRSSTTTSRPSRPPTRTRRTSGCRAGVSRARPRRRRRRAGRGAPPRRDAVEAPRRPRRAGADGAAPAEATP